MKLTIEVQGVRLGEPTEVNIDSLKLEAEYSTEEYTSALATMVQLLSELQNSSTYRTPT